MRMHADEVTIDETLVRHLISTQMSEFDDLSLERVEPWGTDNAVWRLGEDLVVRLPRIHRATGQVDLEVTWLPRLAPSLPISIPEPIAVGEPDDRYPWRWGVFRWLPGVPAGPTTITDYVAFALDLADVVRSLRQIPADGAPPATNRARPIAEYNDIALLMIDHVSDLIDVDAARRVWEAAMEAKPHKGAPVWVQGDIEGNCIVQEGRLSGLLIGARRAQETLLSTFKWCGPLCSQMNPGKRSYRSSTSTMPRWHVVAARPFTKLAARSATT